MKHCVMYLTVYTSISTHPKAKVVLQRCCKCRRQFPFGNITIIDKKVQTKNLEIQTVSKCQV